MGCLYLLLASLACHALCHTLALPFHLAEPGGNATVPARPAHCDYAALLNDPTTLFACRYEMLGKAPRPTLTLLYYTAHPKWLPFVANQLLSLQRVELHNWVILALDPTMAVLCLDHQLPCVNASVLQPHVDPHRDPLRKFNSRNWVLDLAAQILLQVHAINSGYSIVSLDADVAFTVNIWQLVDRPLYRSSQFIAAKEVSVPDCQPNEWNVGFTRAFPNRDMSTLYACWAWHVQRMVRLGDRWGRTYCAAGQTALSIAMAEARRKWHARFRTAPISKRDLHLACFGGCPGGPHVVHIICNRTPVSKLRWMFRYCPRLWVGPRCIPYKNSSETCEASNRLEIRRCAERELAHRDRQEKLTAPQAPQPVANPV
eukprot:GGOE01043790.1.p1 GENE.GGOE01043790.1~~GGOE01043790.1.p1  ORF type:complete len:372 (-),score=86.20 GGOE01043790.1:161-1276(-)